MLSSLWLVFRRCNLLRFSFTVFVRIRCPCADVRLFRVISFRPSTTIAAHVQVSHLFAWRRREFHVLVRPPFSFRLSDPIVQWLSSGIFISLVTYRLLLLFLVEVICSFHHKAFFPSFYTLSIRQLCRDIFKIFLRFFLEILFTLVSNSLLLLSI